MKIYKVYKGKLYEYKVKKTDNGFNGLIYFLGKNDFVTDNALDMLLAGDRVYSFNKEKALEVYNENKNKSYKKIEQPTQK